MKIPTTEDSYRLLTSNLIHMGNQKTCWKRRVKMHSLGKHWIVSWERRYTTIMIKDLCACSVNLMPSWFHVYRFDLSKGLLCANLEDLFVQLWLQLLLSIDCFLCLISRMVLKYMEDAEDFVENVFLTQLLVSSFKYSENFGVVRTSKHNICHLGANCRCCVYMYFFNFHLCNAHDCNAHC